MIEELSLLTEKTSYFIIHTYHLILPEIDRVQAQLTTELSRLRVCNGTPCTQPPTMTRQPSNSPRD